MFNALWDLLCFMLAIGVLVSVHEAGHFFAARMCKVRVLRFSIGFGKVLWSRTGKDGCEYALSLLPLGGYVKMLGEGEEAGSKDPDSFAAKSKKARALIIAAGPLANLGLAVLLYFIVNVSGVNVLRPIAGDVIPASAAAQAGMTADDEITAVNGHEVRSWPEAMMALIKADPDQPVRLELAGSRGLDAKRTVNLTLPADFDLNAPDLQHLGLRPLIGEVTRQIDKVLPDSPAAAAGLQSGDVIEGINGRPLTSWYRLQDAIINSNGQALELKVRRGDRDYRTLLRAQWQEDKAGSGRMMIGVTVKVLPIPDLEREIAYAPLPAAGHALNDTASMFTLVATAVGKMITGQMSADSISGPIAIAKGAGSSASGGLVYFLSFLAAISVNLGILNLLPIPVLDGGQLMFIAYEAAARKAPNAGVQAALTAFGLALLIALSLFAVFNDLQSLF